jgi:low affinity Fe/Cu permease
MAGNSSVSTCGGTMITKLLVRFADWLGCPSGFFWTQGAAVAFGLAGIFVGFSEGWQLAFTLFLSIATYLMGGIILVAQNRDEKAIQEKLDEIIKSLPGTDKSIVGIENKDKG